MNPLIFVSRFLSVENRYDSHSLGDQWRFSRRLIRKLIMTNNLIYAANRWNGNAERHWCCRTAEKEKSFPIHYFAPFYCIQRIRFDLRLLPRVAFVVTFAATRPKAARSQKFGDEICVWPLWPFALWNKESVFLLG